MGRERRTLRGVELQADRVAEIAHRPVAELRRRDVAIALLSVPAEDALASLPAIRRGLLAAGNPLSAPFWESAEAILHKISEHDATFGDVHGWLEATGTEPTGIIGLHVWEEPPRAARCRRRCTPGWSATWRSGSPPGEIDPDRLATGDEDARQEYVALQERWMTTPLPDGRVPMTVAARRAGRGLPRGLGGGRRGGAQRAPVRCSTGSGDRPLPAADLQRPRRRQAARGHRPAGVAGADARLVQRPHRGTRCRPTTPNCGSRWPRRWRRRRADPLSEEDREFARAMEWAEDEDLKFGDDLDEPGADGEPDELSAAIAAVCALDHFDWLAVMSALVTGGPGTPASAADLARYVRDFDPERSSAWPRPVASSRSPHRGRGRRRRRRRGRHAGSTPTLTAASQDVADFGDLDVGDFDEDEDEDFDELSIEGLFLNVTAMWSVLGAIDEDDRLTPLGWWGLPEAMRRAWTE